MQNIKIELKTGTEIGDSNSKQKTSKKDAEAKRKVTVKVITINCCFFN